MLSAKSTGLNKRKDEVFFCMNSIAQNSDFVNGQKTAFVKWNEKKLASTKIAQKMCDAGFLERGARMQFCGHYLGFKECPQCGRTEISSANLCRDRLCPTCQWRLSLRRFAEMCATVSLINDIEQMDAGFLTLTVRNCKPENLRYTLQTMASDWNRLMAQRWIKPLLFGSARSVEITYNARTNTFHPHFHIITFTNPFFEEGDLRARFTRGWQKAARLDYVPVTDFRFIKPDANGSGGVDDVRLTGAILETYKYATKSDELAYMPLDVFRQFVTAIQGLRFSSFTGIVKDARKQLGFKDDENPEEPTPRLLCSCGANMVDGILQWSFSQKQYIKISEVLK